jgi:VanZ family protein
VGRGLDLSCRIAFIVIALTLATLTHWPNLVINAGIPRTDLWAHAIAYSTWTFAFIATGWVAPRGSWKSIGLGMPIALLYAGIDELTQGIPGLGRYVTWEDFAANSVGVWIGATAWAAPLAVRDIIRDAVARNTDP